MKKLTTRQFALLALLSAVLVVLGFYNIPQPAGLSITFNMIPVAIAAIALGVPGGAIIGGVFGVISFLQCFGIAGYSAMGAALVTVNPFLMLIQRFFSRVLVGVLTALFYKFISRLAKRQIAYISTGFMAAFLNTLLFMAALVLLFGGTPYMQERMAGQSVIGFILVSVGVNAVVEMAVSAILTGAICMALHKARFIPDAKE